MADFGQLHVVECFEKLKGEDFSGDGIEGYFFLSLLFYHVIEAAGDVVHDDGEVAFLNGDEKIPSWLFWGSAISCWRCCNVEVLLKCWAPYFYIVDPGGLFWGPICCPILYVWPGWMYNYEVDLAKSALTYQFGGLVEFFLGHWGGTYATRWFFRVGSTMTILSLSIYLII